MKIIDERKPTNGFEQFKVGSTFESDGLVYMKINGVNDSDYGEYFNAVCLNDGSLQFFDDDDEWSPVNTELILK